jgi:energy-coupling factor transporter ATP-binding protein EcfA2
MEQFADMIREFYSDPLDPLAKQFMFRRPPTVGELRRPPQVLMLGNHSSGKSTFINHLLGIDVQKTGVAPTDDNFTIITHGPHETDRDGPSVVSNPDLPYEGLRHFGDQLVSHIRLKLQPAELLQTVTLIDSPGMIDEAKEENGRGFDFPGVVRWFAERSDLVMIFFDPDKPGTTGETLQVFKESLNGIDHKLLIVLNKMDQCQNLHDFARAYGALCWNLGKVIPRKDLPMIYNTYVPLDGKPKSELPMVDFDTARNDLIIELRRAPTRRMDNQITQMQAFAERLRLHSFVIDEAAKRYRRSRTRSYTFLVLLFAALCAGAFVSGLIIALPVLAALAVVVVAIFEMVSLPRKKKRLIKQFDEIFEGLHDRELLVRDRSDDLRAMWEEVHPRAREVAEKRGLQSFTKMSWGDRELLNELIDECIPKLRSELYDALRKVSMDASPARENHPEVDEQPNGEELSDAAVEELSVEEDLSAVEGVAPVEEQSAVPVPQADRRLFRWGRRDADQ